MTCGAVSSTYKLDLAIRLENARQVVSMSGTMDLSTVLTSFEVFEVFEAIEAIVKKIDGLYLVYIPYKEYNHSLISRG